MGVGRIWVVTESTAGAPLPVGLELLTAAHRLGAVVEAVHWGDDAEAVAPALGRHGASTVLTTGHLGPVLPGVPVAAAMASRIEDGHLPDAVLFATTHDQRDIVGRLSARLDRPVLANAVGLAGEAGLVAEHAAFGGATIVRARITGPAPHLFTFRPKAFVAQAVPGAPPATVEGLAVPRTGRAGQATVTRRHVEPLRGPRLDEAAVVVAGGRGLGEPSGFAMVEQLARRLGGAAGATRALVDAGWVPFGYQVGQTGKTVSPTVYLACGISGASQHTVGMRDAKHVIAINKDRHAPIFAMADLGVVGDVNKVLPRLLEALGAGESRLEGERRLEGRRGAGQAGG